MAKWVRHISGQGKKWLVRECPYNKDAHEDWLVDSAATLRDPIQSHTERYHWLPKSEYVECEPPEKWVDVPVLVGGNDGLTYKSFLCVDDAFHTFVAGIQSNRLKFERVSENTFKIMKKVVDN